MQNVVTLPSHAEVNRQFLAMLPELQSRAAILARRCHDRQAAANDALAMMFLNFSGAAQRGTWLRPKSLAWAAQHHLRSRSLTTNVYPSRHRDQIASLDDRHADAGLAARIAAALTTNERSDPAVIAAVRIDWRNFAKTLDRRHRRIVLELATGARKCDIAVSLKISRGRLSQILTQIGAEITNFFGPDGLPDVAQDRNMLRYMKPPVQFANNCSMWPFMSIMAAKVP